MQMGRYVLDTLESWYEAKGGLIDCHRHIDRHNSIDEAGYTLLADNSPLEKKWHYIDQKKASPGYQESLAWRMDDAVGSMRRQGMKACRTYIDVDEILGLMGLEAALAAKKKAALLGFYLQIAAYPIRGIATTELKDLFLAAAERADLIGTLPSRGRNDISDTHTVKKNLRGYFRAALELRKPIDMQIDQKNDPGEHESEVLIQVAREFREKGYTLPIIATHCISLGAQSLAHILLTAQAFRELNIMVVVCPGAAVSTRQNRWQIGPIRNAIAPVEELVGEGVTVALGTDNVSDIFMPFCDGNFRAEITKLADAIRWQGDLSTFADIATTNGRMVLGLPFSCDKE